MSKIIHVISGTHWDREWRYPIWQTRLMLVEFMDELIELLEHSVYSGFFSWERHITIEIEKED